LAADPRQLAAKPMALMEKAGSSQTVYALVPCFEYPPIYKNVDLGYEPEAID
jgi:hypothetical protein